ncbi:aminoglycoside phosphotransferase [Actinocatenispora thailandica]|uniref:Aminoglycoside phosphotransferase n=1 Tax=Actinocatenispora thailandica TaxID=227318 RepID=A0A7R7HWR8_9ACTN|nr:aminoglycoside phosphotransferase family protein [Actinocatenispora thailandica]BCJ35178.1 aminoglycoside phosphotransferase [Actinocatenispora thailandica]
MRRTVDPTALAPVVRAATGRRPVTVDRLTGGSKKGVYRVRLDDGSTVVVYLWRPDEDLWPAATRPVEGSAEPFAHASGYQLFVSAHRRLAELGVGVPEILLGDAQRRWLDADVMVVEDVAGPSLEARLRQGPQPSTMDALAAALERMHRCPAPAIGKVGPVESGARIGETRCERIVSDRALADLAEAARREPRLAAAEDRLATMLRALCDRVSPRRPVGLIHGELGGDHVLVRPDGAPVLIDIEGAMYFDPEWEHAFARIRFGADHPLLVRGALDPDRLRFYTLAEHLSLVAGPLRLLDGDVPDRAGFAAIAEYNLRAALRFDPDRDGCPVER